MSWAAARTGTGRRFFSKDPIYWGWFQLDCPLVVAHILLSSFSPTRMDEIHFYCAACGADLRALAENAGGFCDCPHCRRVAPIPGYRARRSDSADFAGVFSPKILAIEIKFFGNCCGEKFRVDARLQGMTLDCPVCHKPTKIPEWGGALPPAELTESPARADAPLSRLSPEECEFLSAPMKPDGRALIPAGSN